MIYCPVCLDAHDPEIHAATKRVHRWFRHRLKRMLIEVPTGQYRVPGYQRIKFHEPTLQGENRQ